MSEVHKHQWTKKWLSGETLQKRYGISNADPSRRYHVTRCKRCDRLKLKNEPSSRLESLCVNGSKNGETPKLTEAAIKRLSET